MRGTRTRHQHASAGKPADAILHQPRVGANRPGALGFTFRERRGIENDQPEFPGIFTRQPFKGVGLNLLMTALRDGGIGGVEFEITLRRRQRMRADVQIGRRFCAAARRIKRKAAGKTEGVQHVATSEQVFSTSKRFSRWSRKNPVFCPRKTSASNRIPFSKNTTGSARAGPNRISPSRLPASDERNLLDVPAQAQDEPFRVPRECGRARWFHPATATRRRYKVSGPACGRSGRAPVPASRHSRR